MADHEIVVGNIGTVYSGTSGREAHRLFRLYRYQSKLLQGRASGEDVTWFKDYEVYAEYIGKLSIKENAQ